MKIKNKDIDAGKAFDFGKVSTDYAKFRDIYPQEFYHKILNRKLCIFHSTENLLKIFLVLMAIRSDTTPENKITAYSYPLQISNKTP